MDRHPFALITTECHPTFEEHSEYFFNNTSNIHLIIESYACDDNVDVLEYVFL